MSAERKLILKMVQEQRISVEEADQLLEALNKPQAEPQKPPSQSGKTTHTQDLFSQAGPKVEQMMGGLSSMVDAVSNQWGPKIGKRFEQWFQQETAQDKPSGSSPSKTPSGVSQRDEKPLPEGVKHIVLHYEGGDLSVTGDDRSNIQTLWRSQGALEAEPIWHMQQEGEQLHITLDNIDSNLKKGIQIDLELKIPKTLSVDLSSAQNDIQVKGLQQTEGHCKIQNKNGDIHIEQLATQELSVRNQSGQIFADQISEKLTLNNHSGDIQLKGQVYQAEVQTQSADIELSLSIHQSLQAETQAGDISLNLIEGQGSIQLQSQTGDLEISGVLNSSADLNTAQGDIQTRLTLKESGSAHLVSNQGDLDLMLDRSSQCQVDLSSQSGDVESRLDLTIDSSSPRQIKGKLGSGEGIFKAQTLQGDILLS